MPNYGDLILIDYIIYNNIFLILSLLLPNFALNYYSNDKELT